MWKFLVTKPGFLGLKVKLKVNKCLSRFLGGVM